MAKKGLKVSEKGKVLPKKSTTNKKSQKTPKVVNSVKLPLKERFALLNKKRTFNVFITAPSFLIRKKVYEQVVTGILVIDTLFPLGKGQRTLILGDRQTGKSSIAIDIVINQVNNILLKNQPIFCIYVIIGQKLSNTAYMLAIFRKYSCYYYTSVVSATAKASAGLQYLAPFIGCALGESYMYTGRQALVVYDDLSKHSLAYRQISLILRRMPGREAYPTDIFWIHAQLLERAAKLDDSNGSGSLTALPIAETVGGSVAAFITTNLISITDGQIYTDISLFNRGIKPAINMNLSVSRVGSTVQCAGMRYLSGLLKFKLMEYYELERFDVFDSSNNTIQNLLSEGSILVEFLKQPLHVVFNIVEQLILLFTVRYKYIYNLKINKIFKFKCWLINILKKNKLYNNYFYWFYDIKNYDNTNKMNDDKADNMLMLNSLVSDCLFLIKK